MTQKQYKGYQNKKKKTQIENVADQLRIPITVISSAKRRICCEDRFNYHIKCLPPKSNTQRLQRLQRLKRQIKTIRGGSLLDITNKLNGNVATLLLYVHCIHQHLRRVSKKKAVVYEKLYSVKKKEIENKQLLIKHIIILNESRII